MYGTFFLCGEDGENFCSLTNEQVERYLARFREPEIICDMPDAIICFPCSPQRYRRYMEGLNIGNGLERPDHQGGAARVAFFSVLPRYAFSSEVLIVLSAKKVWKSMAEAPPQIFCLGGSLRAKMRYNRGNEEENL